jgi:hypothetical protein
MVTPVLRELWTDTSGEVGLSPALRHAGRRTTERKMADPGVPGEYDPIALKIE